MTSNFETTFTQLNVRLKNFLKGWLLVLGLKECLVECATFCVKSEVMLLHLPSPFETPHITIPPSPKKPSRKIIVDQTVYGSALMFFVELCY